MDPRTPPNNTRVAGAVDEEVRTAGALREREAGQGEV